MNCPVCNAKQEDYNYCGKCGFQLKDPFPNTNKKKKKSKSEEGETAKPLDTIKFCSLNAYLTSPMDPPDLINQLFLWLQICSGLLKIEFCDCSQCKKIYSMFLSRARRKGDYDVDTWKEIHTQDLNGKIFPMTDIVKICASHQEENEGEKHTKDIPKQSEATPEIPHGKRKCPQCKSKNTDMDAKTHIQHCLDCGAAWEYIVRHRLHMIQKGTK